MELRVAHFGEEPSALGLLDAALGSATLAPPVTAHTKLTIGNG